MKWILRLFKSHHFHYSLAPPETIRAARISAAMQSLQPPSRFNFIPYAGPSATKPRRLKPKETPVTVDGMHKINQIADLLLFSRLPITNKAMLCTTNAHADGENDDDICDPGGEGGSFNVDDGLSSCDDWNSVWLKPNGSARELHVKNMDEILSQPSPAEGSSQGEPQLQLSQ
jgi:hypothetical protein